MNTIHSSNSFPSNINIPQFSEQEKELFSNLPDNQRIDLAHELLNVDKDSSKVAPPYSNFQSKMTSFFQPQPAEEVKNPSKVAPASSFQSKMTLTFKSKPAKVNKAPSKVSSTYSNFQSSMNLNSEPQPAKDWTSEEDDLLRQLVRIDKRVQWRTISKKIGNEKTAKDCKDRWSSFITPITNNEEWTLEEDEKLRTLAIILGTESWIEIANRMQNGKIDRQCKYRWEHHVDPVINHEKWNLDEIQRLRELVVEYGINAWGKIANEINVGKTSKLRTAKQCKTEWRNLSKELETNKPLYKTGKWSPEEISRFQKIATNFLTDEGEIIPCWDKIAEEFNKNKTVELRSPNQCKNKWIFIYKSQCTNASKSTLEKHIKKT